MQSQFVNGFVSILSTMVEPEILNLVAEQLTVYVCDFEISKRNTEVAVIDYFPDCAKAYLATRKVEGLSDKTIYNYHMHIRKFFEFVMMPIDKVKKSDIIRYLYGLTTCDRSKSATLTVLKTFFQWCVNEDYLEKNPCKNIKPIKYQRKPPEHLTDMELEMLRSACVSLREKAMVEFFYSTGCRVSEAINANRSDINFQTGEVTLIGKGNKQRVDYLNPKAQIALMKYFDSRTDESEALFVSERKPHNRIRSKNTMENDFAEIGKRAGITKHVHPHLLRHTNATLALEKGMPLEEVQKMLGHVDINTTLVYAEVANENVKRNHKRCIV